VLTQGERLLSLAEERIFSLGVDDSASRLSYTNMRYGLAKIISALLERGTDIGETFCVLGPDATITRNIERWNSGFGYGCFIHWPGEGYTREKVIFPEVRPNACGMILAVIDGKPQSKKELLSRICEVKERELFIGGVPIQWDLDKGNHFIETHLVEDSRWDGMPIDSHTALIHTSISEFKSQLYGFEAFGGRWVDTPFGGCYVLEGEAADEYFDRYKRLEVLSREKRRLLLTEIFGDCMVVCNPIHQGLSASNVVRLGVYDSTENSTCPSNTPLFPLALRWDIPVYLMRGFQNLSPGVMAQLGFLGRAEELGITDLMENMNILPHGGGYELVKPLRELEDVHRTKRGLYRIVAKGERPLVFLNPRGLPYTYRGEVVLRAAEEHGLGESMAELRQVCSFKV
jgi:hypothetical protein